MYKLIPRGPLTCQGTFTIFTPLPLKCCEWNYSLVKYINWLINAVGYYWICCIFIGVVCNNLYVRSMLFSENYAMRDPMLLFGWIKEHQSSFLCLLIFFCYILQPCLCTLYPYIRYLNISSSFALVLGYQCDISINKQLEIHIRPNLLHIWVLSLILSLKRYCFAL